MKKITKKIFFHPDLAGEFEKYGIQIPLVDDRATRCFESLQSQDSSILPLEMKELPKITKHELELVHQKDFVERLLNPGTSEGELIKCYELLDAGGNYFRYDPSGKKPLREMVPSILNQVAATCLAAEQALDLGFTFFLGGGMHHAMDFAGRGFCPVNDILIAIARLKEANKINSAWVIDTDVHKGDGTAQISYQDSSVSTLSIHMKKGWPLDGPAHDSEGKLRPWFIPSTIDIPIAEGEESSYLEKLEQGLFDLEKRTGLPELAMVVAGVDPYEKDVLPSSSKINLSKGKMLARDLLVYTFLKERSVPQCWVMGGGYGPDSHQIYTQFLERVLEL